MKRILMWLLVVLLFFGCSNDLQESSTEVDLIVDSTSRIVCFGDSLTAGYGALESEAYPAILSEMVTIPVINSGFSGYSSEDALFMIQSAVLDHNPVIVIIEFGANDYFQNSTDFDITVVENNLKQIIEEIQNENTVIYLAKYFNYEVAFDVLSGDMEYYNDFENMFQNLKNQYAVRIIDDIWKNIWKDSSLMSDDVHPNAEGYIIMAQNYFESIKSLLDYNGLIK